MPALRSRGGACASLLLLSLLSLLCLPASVFATDCAANTYSDGAVRTGTAGFLRILANNKVDIVGVDFTLELWARRRVPSINHVLFALGLPADNPGTNAMTYVRYNTANTWSWQQISTSDTATTSAVITTPSPDTVWHHMAFTFQASTRTRTMFRDGVQIASSVATALDNSVSFQQINFGARSTGTNAAPEQQWDGDIDEVLLFNSVKTLAQINLHRRGQFFGERDPNNGCMLWLRFEDQGASTTAKDWCSQDAANTAVWVGTPTWLAPSWPGTSTADEMVCLPGYWSAFRLVATPSPSLRVGETATVTVCLVDQYGACMSDYVPSLRALVYLPATTVRVFLTGSSGLPSALRPDSILLSFPLGSGISSATYSDDVAENVTFSMVDWEGTGRSIVMPTAVSQTWFPRFLTTVSFVSPTEAGRIAYAPALVNLVKDYNATVEYSSASLTVRAVYGGAATGGTGGTVTASSTNPVVNLGSLTSGQDSAQAVPLTAGQETVFTLQSSPDGGTGYKFRVTRRAADITDLTLVGSSGAITLSTPPATDTHDYTASVPLLLSLSVSVTFNPAASGVSLTVNGVVFGALTSAVAKDASSALRPSPAPNVVEINSTNQGRYTVTLNVGCPLAFTCLTSSVVGCEYECFYCRGGSVFRRVCLEAKPDCCGGGDPACLC